MRDVTEGLLRLFQFRPTDAGSVLDARLRESAVPALLAARGVRAVWVGRHGDEHEHRLVVSAWESLDVLQAALDGRAPEQLELEPDSGLADVTVETYPIRVFHDADGAPPASILRVFRGRTRPGELDAYAADVRAGLEEDLAGGHGPVALCLAVDPPDRFVTVSVWAAWADVEASTGGDVRNPAATRRAGRLAAGSAVHYELVPNVTRPATTP